MSLKARVLAVAAAGASLLVAACGGGDSGDTSGSSNIGRNPDCCTIWNHAPTTVRYVAIDLFSDGHGSMSGWGIGDGEQVGDCVCNPFIGNERALLWRGSAWSFVDLHPTGFT